MPRCSLSNELPPVHVEHAAGAPLVSGEERGVACIGIIPPWVYTASGSGLRSAGQPGVAACEGVSTRRLVRTEPV
jgi:hypothetical protein